MEPNKKKNTALIGVLLLAGVGVIAAVLLIPKKDTTAPQQTQLPTQTQTTNNASQTSNSNGTVAAIAGAVPSIVGFISGLIKPKETQANTDTSDMNNWTMDDLGTWVSTPMEG